MMNLWHTYVPEMIDDAQAYHVDRGSLLWRDSICIGRSNCSFSCYKEKKTEGGGSLMSSKYKIRV